MDRFVAFLDVGYLDAASASTLKQDKRKITAKPDEWVKWLKKSGEDFPGAPTFLRAYWYDGAYDPRHPNYRAQRNYLDGIAEIPGIQLRLGHLKVKKTPRWHYAVKVALRNMGIDQVASTLCVLLNAAYMTQRFLWLETEIWPNPSNWHKRKVAE